MASIGVSVKDSSLCLGLHCECGHVGHHHGYFAYHLVCGGCGRTYKVEVQALVVEAPIAADEPVLLEDKTMTDANRMLREDLLTRNEFQLVNGADLGVTWKDYTAEVLTMIRKWRAEQPAEPEARS